MFGNCVDLGDASRTHAEDTISGTSVPIPSVEALFVGFSCKDVSGMNIYSMQFTERMSNEEGTTYKTMFGTLGYVTIHKPKVVVMENVVLFGVVGGIRSATARLGRNCTCVLRAGGPLRITEHLRNLLQALEVRGYVAVPMLLDPRKEGMCQRRVRLYVVAIRNRQPLEFSDIKEETLQLAQQVLAMEALPLRRVETFLFQDDSDNFNFWDSYAFV